MATETKKVLHGPGGLRVVLDRTRVVPDDPGADTPAMVYLFGASATLWCAMGEGELMGDRAARKLSEAQCRWLDDVAEPEASAFLYPKEAQS